MGQLSENASNTPAGSLHAADDQSWTNHEQTSDQTQLSAQALIEQAGSIELAQHAISNFAKDSSSSPTIIESDKPLPLSIREDSPFTKALTQFERLLQTPIVSGDIAQWIDQVQQAAVVVRTQWDMNHHATHDQAFESIIAQADDLSSQIEKLKEEDHLLYNQELPKITHSLGALTRQANESETGTSGSEQKIDAVKKMALNMVVRALTQETAISTWYMESLYRDSGAGD